MSLRRTIAAGLTVCPTVRRRGHRQIAARLAVFGPPRPIYILLQCPVNYLQPAVMLTRPFSRDQDKTKT